MRRQRGVTLVELMMSLAVIVIGLLVIFRVLASSVAGSSSSSRVAQAQARAEAIIEAIRLAPPNALICLRNTPAASWATCEATCMSLQAAGGAASASTCMFSPASFQYINGPRTNVAATPVTTQQYDRLGQAYVLDVTTVPASAAQPAQMGSTYVRQVGDGLRTWEAVVSVGWNDDNTVLRNNPADHAVTMATGIFQ